VKEERQVDI